MSKIEQQMIDAVKNRKQWQLDNTQVISLYPSSVVLLHGNMIATWLHDDCRLVVNIDALKKWPTNTTKSRLRALGANVTTKRGVTYLDGKEV